MSLNSARVLICGVKMEKPEVTLYQALGAEVRAFRRRHGFKLDEFAVIIGFEHRHSLNLIENGKRRLSIKHIVNMCRAVDAHTVPDDAAEFIRRALERL